MNDAVNVLASQEIPAPDLLPLDARDRVAVFRSKGKTYRHTFRRLMAADWEKFYSRVAAEFKQEKEGLSQMVDSDDAALVLWRRAIIAVEGYQTPDGRAASELPEWQELIPDEHQLGAAKILMHFWKSEIEEDESMLQPEGRSVFFDATWNEGEPGAMKTYLKLEHKFSKVTAEHRRRFLHAKSHSFLVGGSRNAKTIVPSAHPVLVKLYDELIERVSGYGVDGRELRSKEEIIREMDSSHKNAAMASMFNFSGDVLMGGAKQ